jgi:hypothetical protein
MGGKGDSCRKIVGDKGQNELWRGAMDLSTGEGENEGYESRDEKMMTVKLIAQKEKEKKIIGIKMKIENPQ